MKKITPLFKITIFLLIIISCRFEEKQSGIEAKGNLNTSITISAPPIVNTFNLGDFVRVEVRNNSDHEILLSLDNAIDLKVKQQDGWAPISMTQKFSRKILLSSRNQEESSLTLLSIIPQLQSGKVETIRITIKGIDQLTNQEVFGYVDITLSP